MEFSFKRDPSQQVLEQSQLMFADLTKEIELEDEKFLKAEQSA